MSRLVVLIMDSNIYPFGESDSGYNQKKKIMVRNRIQFQPQNKQSYLRKAKYLKKLTNPYLIKLQQLLQQDNSLHLLYEYVPIKVQTWIQNINIQFIESFKSQLFQFSDYLAQNKLILKFELKNIGMNQNYQPKYFTGINFQIKQNLNLNVLKAEYRRQINNLFSKYIGNEIILEEKPIDQIVFTKNQKFQSQKSVQKKSYCSGSLKQLNQFSEEKPRKSINVFSSLQYKKRVATETSQNSIEEEQKNIIKKTTSMGENQMKQTLKNKRNIKQKQNIIKIDNLGEKINNIRTMLQNMNNGHNKNYQKQKSTSPMAYCNKSKIGTKFFYQKKKSGELSLNNSKLDESNQNFQVKSQVQFDKMSQGGRNNNFVEKTKLKRSNQKSLILQKSKIKDKKGKNCQDTQEQKPIQKQTRDINNYYDEFMRILQDDGQVNPQKKLYISQDERSSPFSTSQSSCSKFQPYKPQKQELDRKSYPRLIKPIQKRNSQTSNDSEIQSRINAAINTSKKLISSIRKNKPNQ